MQAHKILTLTTKKPALLYEDIISGKTIPYNTGVVASDHIRLPLNTSLRTFRNRVMISYNKVLAQIKVGTVGK